MKFHELMQRLRESSLVSRFVPGRRGRGRGDAATIWSIERARERQEAEQAEGDVFVRYHSILRTNDVSRLLILQLHLDREGIRHYRSQNNMLHGGEVQLFVETERIQEAEELLGELDAAAD